MLVFSPSRRLAAPPFRPPARFRASSSSARSRALPKPRTATGTAATGAAARGGARTAEGLGFPLGVGVVHLAVVQLVASLAYRFGTPTADSAPYSWVPPELGGWAGIVVEPLRLWDGLWYTLIAEQGYDGAPGGFEGAPLAYPAFFPLFPWLMRLGSDLFGVATETAGWVIANAGFLAALVVLYRLVALDFDRTVARRTVVALAVFPTSFFFSAVYTESLFLLLAVGALYAARRGVWFTAGALGLLAALTRSQGVFLLLPFAVLLWQQFGPALRSPRRWAAVLPTLLFAALPVLGPIIFGLHLERTDVNALNRREDQNPAFEAGNPMPWALDRIGLHDPAFVYVQFQWNRFEADPITTLRCAVSGCTETVVLGNRDPATYRIEGAEWGWIGDLASSPTWGTLTSEGFRKRVAEDDWLELACAVLFFALAVVGLRRLPPYYSTYAIPPLLVPLFAPSTVHPLMSMPRFGLVLFPLFVVLALLIRDRRQAMVLGAVSTVGLVLLTMQFAQWYWVS